MTFLLSFLSGTIGRYILIGLGGLLLLAWFRADATAPYQRQIAALHKASEQKDEIIKNHKARLLEDKAEEERLRKQLSETRNANDQSNACRPTDDELRRLRGL